MRRTGRIGVEAAERPHETSTREEGAGGWQGHAPDVVLQTPTKEQGAQWKDKEHGAQAASQPVAGEAQAVALDEVPLDSVVGDLTANGAAEEETATGGEVEETAGQGGVEAEALADGESNGAEETVLVEGEETACDVLWG